MNTIPSLTLEWVRKEKARLKAVLADLDATERVMLMQNVANPAPSPIVPTNGYGSKKQILLAIIRGAGAEGLTVRSIISEATKLGQENWRIENTSPKLSAYKHDELIDLHEGRWRITDKGRSFLAAEETNRGQTP